MSTSEPQRPIQVVHRYFELLNAHALTDLGEVLSDDFEPHLPQPGPGRTLFLGYLDAYAQAFPDLRHELLRSVVEGEQVVVQVRSSGTHRGTFLGHPPSGLAFRADGIDMFRVVGSQIVERWGCFDTLSMLIQLGLYSPGVPT